MKKIINIVAVAVVVLFTGCEKYLDTDNLYQKDLANFYKTPTDINEAMNGVYNSLFVDGVHSNEHVASNLMSDVMLGGGGPDDKSAKDVDKFLDPGENTYGDLWKQTYNGVGRANAIIESVENGDFSQYFFDEQEAIDYKNSTLAEAYFMRGFLMFRAARFFGGMPLIRSVEADRKAPRASLEDTWAAIISDFKTSADLFPVKAAQAYPLNEYGHANVWVAKAYVAKAYLHFTGYMTNIEGTPTDAVVLLDGSTLTKENVISELNDIINNSGYELVSDFRNLWPYSYVNQNAADFDPEGVTPFVWAENEGLAWVGQDGPNSTTGTGNNEVMFALRYGLADWSFGQKFNNRVPLFFGIRDHSMVPFGQGWGWGTVHNVFFDTWDNQDIRKKGSVLDLNSKDPEFGLDGWNIGKGDHNTGLVNMKYTSLQHNGEEGIKGLFFYLYNMVHGDPMQLQHAQDFYYLRFADVLLMHSELTETNTGLNAVRQRAGLGDVAYSLEALKRERLYEFAFEGVRWFDLVRWGDVNGTGNFFGVEAKVNNSGVDGVYTTSYREETKGLVPVPESEIQLSGGVYQQNPGW